MYKQTIELDTLKLVISLTGDTGTMIITDKLKGKQIKLAVEKNKIEELRKQKREAILSITYLIALADEDEEASKLWKHIKTSTRSKS